MKIFLDQNIIFGLGKILFVDKIKIFNYLHNSFILCFYLENRKLVKYTGSIEKNKRN